MNDTGIPQVTTSDREHNPKAVFFGENSHIVNPLALYLDGNNVDLFSGKNLHDAFFGDYFFYVGEAEDVKAFLESQGTQLPRSLFLCFPVSDPVSVEQWFVNLGQTKLVWVDSDVDLDEKQVGRIMEFFFGSTRRVMTLAKDVKKNFKLDTGAVTKTPASLQPIASSPQFQEKTAAVQSETTTTTSAPGALFQTTVVAEEEIRQEIATTTPAAIPVPVKTFEHIPFLNASPREVQLETPLSANSATPGEKGPVEKSLPKLGETREVATSPTEKTEAKITADLTEPNFTQTELGRKLENLYGNSTPKQTGRSATKPIKRVPLLSAAIMGLVFFLVFPVVALFAEHTIAYVYVQQGKQAAEKQQLTQAEKYFGTASFYSNLGVKNLELFAGLFDVFKQRSVYSQLHDFSAAQSSVAVGGRYLTQAAAEGIVLLKGIAGKDNGVPYGQVVAAAKGYLTLADTELAKAQALLKASNHSAPSDGALSALTSRAVRAELEVSQAREAVHAGRGILSLVPEGIGLYGKRTYLLLFQNNMELRPTGGFIGSYGLVTFEEGQLKDVTIEDVYTADGSLKGHVEPPGPIQTYLEQEHWFLRDSNWDPDFERSGARAAWFLDKELGVSVDGVIAVNLNLIQNLLQVMGPISLPDYSEAITHENIFELAHNEIQTDFFPGSTKKRDLLGSLGRALITKLLQEEYGAKPEVLVNLYHSLGEKRALVYFNSPAMQEVVRQLGWAGTVVKPGVCAQDACRADSLFLVDANLGVNKSNYFIERSLADEIAISARGIIEHTVTITYKNNSPSDETEIGGVYRNYARVYIPQDAELIKAQQNELLLTLDDDLVASASSVVSSMSHDLQSLETLVEVSPQTEVRLSFVYVVAAPDNLSEYQLLWQKQPGTAADPIAITLTFPQTWTAQVTGDTSLGNVAGASTLVNTGQITYNSLLARDQTLVVEFRKDN